MTTTEQRIILFARMRKLKTDLPSRLKKFSEEMGELAEAIANRDKEGIRMEGADCAIILVHILWLCGFSLEEAMNAKMQINEGRHIWTPRPGSAPGAFECLACNGWTANLPRFKNEPCPAFAKPSAPTRLRGKNRTLKK